MDLIFENVEFQKLHGDIKVQTRTVINNVFLFLDELKRNPEKVSQLDFNKSQENTALICGVSKTTVGRIQAEISHFGRPAVPREFIAKPSPVTNGSVDLCLLERIIKTLNESADGPTVAKILREFSKHKPNFKCGKTSMKRILIDNGYKFKKNAEGRKYLGRK